MEVTIGGSRYLRAIETNAIRQNSSVHIKLAFAAFVVVHTLQIWLHVPWSDEYQAWLIAKESTIGTILQTMKYEGHPPLWHIVLMALQTVTSDPAAMKLVQWSCAIATTAIILWFAPFSLLLRILVASNYFLLFEYPINARSYTLGMLLWALAMLGWRHWSFWLCAMAMAFVSIHFAVFVCAIVLYRSCTVGWSWQGLALVVASVLASCAATIPDPATIPAIEWLKEPYAHRSFSGVIATGSVALPLGPFGGWFFWDWSNVYKFAQLASVLVLAVATLAMLETQPLARLITFGLLAFVFLFSTFVYPMFVRHVGVVALFVITLAWAGAYSNTRARQVFTALSAGWMIQGVIAVAIAASPSVVFSSTTQAARWIIDNGLAEKPWVAQRSLTSVSFTALSGKPVYSLYGGCLSTYARWNHSGERMPDAEARQRLIDRAAGASTVYYMIEERPDDAQRPKGIAMTPLATFGRDIQNFTTTLYRVDVPPGAPARPYPRCH